MLNVIALGLLLLFSACTVGQSVAQTLTVDKTTAATHLLKRVEPLYPPIAQAANVTGTVELNATVGSDGSVTSVKAVSGPPMLIQASIDAVRGWRYAPFQQEGKAIQTVVPVSLIFGVAPDKSKLATDQRAAAQAWFPVNDKCRAALRERDANAAVKVCKQGVDLADSTGLQTSSDKLGDMDAHEEYGHALLLARRPSEALIEEEKAVARAAADLKPSDEEYANTLYWRATAQQALGHNVEALSDYTKAEASMREAIQHLPSMAAIYGRDFAAILNQHAALLESLGKRDEAAKLRQEAPSSR